MFSAHTTESAANFDPNEVTIKKSRPPRKRYVPSQRTSKREDLLWANGPDQPKEQYLYNFQPGVAKIHREMYEQSKIFFPQIASPIPCSSYTVTVSDRSTGQTQTLLMRGDAEQTRSLQSNSLLPQPIPTEQLTMEQLRERLNEIQLLNAAISMPIDDVSMFNIMDESVFVVNGVNRMSPGFQQWFSGFRRDQLEYREKFFRSYLTACSTTSFTDPMITASLGTQLGILEQQNAELMTFINNASPESSKKPKTQRKSRAKPPAVTSNVL